MFLRVCSLIACMMLLVCPAFCARGESAGPQRYTQTFYDAFDTVISLIGYAENEAVFSDLFSRTREIFVHYHRIYDAYSAYEGVNNLYALNHAPADVPVPVEKELMDLILWVKGMQPLLNGRVNIAMGSVLEIWHAYREEGTALPPMEALLDADLHIDINTLIPDEENLTITKTDGRVKIDLGAVAKGYTVERAAEMLLASAMPSFIINAGGNVRCGHKPYNGKNAWSVGIENPDSVGSWLDLIYVNDLSVVTSGDYQRYYTVDGVRYHHIIDPDTLMPSAFMRSVTIVTEDSGLADLLSTALFNMPYEEGRALIDSIDGAEAYWICPDGQIFLTDGLVPMLYSRGAVNQ